MAEMLTKSFLMGLDRSTRKMEFAEPTAEEIETLPYAEAVEYLRKRDVLNKVDYDRLSAQLKFRAFTASRISDGALLKHINGELIKNIEAGNGLKDFLGMTKTDVLSKVGLGNAGGWYWETVYRTNVQTSYNAGRMMGYEQDKPLALELVVIDDARTTDYCRQYAGKGFVLPYDDPFWKTHIPPFHFNCRTTIRAIYAEREIPQQWSSKGAIEEPAKGFGNNPVVDDSWWKELSSQVRQAKMYGVQGEIEKAEKLLFNIQSENYGGRYGGILDKSNEEQESYAKRAYEEIRNKNELFDIEKVSNSSGIKKEDIKKVRDHIFINKHLLNGEMKRFDESPEIALAWEALEQNRASDKDILLVKHELEELTIMENLGYNYDIAHLYANKKYPWEYKLKGGWIDDSIQADIERRLKLLL